MYSTVPSTPTATVVVRDEAIPESEAAMLPRPAVDGVIDKVVGGKP